MHINQINEYQTQTAIIRSSKGKATNNTQGDPHKDNSDILIETLQARTEKAMSPYSSTLAWKIPWMEKPGGLRSMGS